MTECGGTAQQKENDTMSTHYAFATIQQARAFVDAVKEQFGIDAEAFEPPELYYDGPAATVEGEIGSEGLHHPLGKARQLAERFGGQCLGSTNKTVDRHRLFARNLGR
jgi:hypothetical protein